MSADVDALAVKMNLTRIQTLVALQEFYDGYHFAAQSPDIFNPYSLLNAMAAGCLDYYWFTSGTPTYLIEMLKKFQVMPSDIGRCEADKSDFDVALGNMNSILPILYQSGCITIKDYDPETKLFTLDIPNKEAQKALTW